MEARVRAVDLRGAWEFCVAVARRFYEDRSIQTAGSLTYTTLLSLVPLVTVALALSTAFPVFDHAIAALEQFIVGNFLPETGGGKAVMEQLNAFTASAGRLTAIGIAFLAVTAIMLMLTIDEAMNRIFRVMRPRPYAQRLIMYWAVLTLGPVLIGASLSMTSFLVGSSLGLLDLGWLTEAVLRAVPFLFTCAAFMLLYLVVPYRRIELRHALTGGVAAGMIFEFAKRGFALYVAKFPTYTLIYGAFAAVPIFLLWVYLSWLVVLFGATITAMLPAFREARAEGAGSPGRDLVDALAVLNTLARAQTEGRVLTINRIAAQVKLLPYRCERVLERAAALGWTAKTEKDGWLLARDAEAIRLADIYRAFVLDPEAHGNKAGPAPRLSAPLAEHWRHVQADMSLTLRQLAQEEVAE
jgi:membrane protein